MSKFFLEGISIDGYRSFKDSVELKDLSKINFIIGQNNSGKSNVLRFLTKHYPSLNGGKGRPFNKTWDRCKGKDQNILFGIQIKGTSPIAINIANSFETNRDHILSNFFLKHDNESFWFYYEEEGQSLKVTERSLKVTSNRLNLDSGEWRFLVQSLGANGGKLSEWQTHVLNKISPHNSLETKTDLIPAIRSLRIKHSTASEIKEDGLVTTDGLPDHSGAHLIEDLNRIINPTFEREKDLLRFATITSFIRDVIGNDTASLSIPHDKSTVIVTMDGKRLPIDSLGSGIEEVLIIAAKSTLFSKQIVCIEEPELHLHPSLQRKLIKYLHEETDNQYFIATHSANILDSVPASIYHIKQHEGYSQVTAAINDKKKFDACKDLGYKASDILQSNFVIWVEGPSDRIYLNHWISSLDDSLSEGLHYSIMFYGGRLLSHLTAEDEAVDDFIQLHRLNRNMGIVIDSDKKSDDVEINDTKKRIIAEFQSTGQFVWLTQGREIENYLSEKIYTSSISACHKSLKKAARTGQFLDMTVFSAEKEGKTVQRSIDKIKLAHQVESKPADLEVLDLGERIRELIQYIKSANLINV